MEFFDKKEEVIDLKLTQYGKYLLSLGKLNPTFYAFHDENIIYDSQYAGFSETQNEAEGRIQNDTPNTKTIHNFHSIEDDIIRAIEVKNSGDPDLAQMMLQQTPEKSQILINPLANSSLSTDKAPSWNISLMSGKILTGSTTSTLTLSSSAAILNIPQIEVELKYRVHIENGAGMSDEELQQIAAGVVEGMPQNINEDSVNPLSNELTFSDDSFFNVEQKDLIFQIIEENTPPGNDNFEIEFFEIEDVNGNGIIQNTSTVTEIKQLRMLVEPDLVVNDILIDRAEGNYLNSSKIDTSFVDFYFDVEIDDEIDSSLMCRLLSQADEDEYKFARKDFVCPDVEQVNTFTSPYSQKNSNSCGDNG
jgi:hypothetical protein